MKPLFLITSAAALVWLAGCSDHSAESPKSAATPGEAAPESRVKQATNGTVVITLDGPTQQLMGLQTAILAAVSLSPELKAYGRVLDSTTLVSLSSELATAQSEGRVAQLELQRLKTLAAQSNASQRALQGAEATAARAQAQLDSARFRLAGTWGNAIAGREDLGAFVQGLSTLSNALVLLEVPAGEPLPTTPRGARLVTLTPSPKPVAAQWLGPAPSVDPQMQGRGFLFVVSPNLAGLAPGAAVMGYLELPGEARSGVALPGTAILRFNGATWVYRQTATGAFERVEVSLEEPTADGWFVRETLQPEDKVVVVGAQQLLSEELKGHLKE